MLINCDNKGCMKASDALLNVHTLEVICKECGNAISNVSEPMKRTLKSFGQILRNEDKKAFMMACKTCNANREVVLNGNKTVCKVCKGEIKVHAAMKQAILDVGSKLVSLEDDVEPTLVKTKKMRKAKPKV